MFRLLSAIGAVLILILISAAPVLAVRPAHYDGSWTSYLFDDQHSGYSVEESIITPSTVPSLTKRWEVHEGSAVSDQPATWNAHIFWGSWDGYMHADTIYGKRLWRTFLGTTNVSGCDPQTVGVASSPAVISDLRVGSALEPVVIVGGGDAAIYALNANTGAVIWRTRLGTKSEAFEWSSPMVDGNHVFIGVSSFGDCPLVQGKVVKLNASTGAIEATFDTTPDGCTGDGVWSTPTLDSNNQELYVSTGNSGDCAKAEPYAQSVIALRESDLKAVGFWSVPPSQQVWDSDFGATPTMFTARTNSGSVEAVGVANKNGWYYAFNAANLAAGPLWESKIGAGGPGPQDGSGNISSSSWDGSLLYAASGKTRVHGKVCEGSLRAIVPQTGHYLWQKCLAEPVLGAVQTMPGMVEVAFGDVVLVVAAESGKTLYRHEFAGAEFWGPAAISQGTIYQGDINGNLFALTPAGAF